MHLCASFVVLMIVSTIAVMIYEIEEPNQPFLKKKMFTEQRMMKYHKQIKLGSSYPVFAQLHILSSLSEMK